MSLMLISAALHYLGALPRLFVHDPVDDDRLSLGERGGGDALGGLSRRGAERYEEYDEGGEAPQSSSSRLWITRSAQPSQARTPRRLTRTVAAPAARPAMRSNT